MGSQPNTVHYVVGSVTVKPHIVAICGREVIRNRVGMHDYLYTPQPILLVGRIIRSYVPHESKLNKHGQTVVCDACRWKELAKIPWWKSEAGIAQSWNRNSLKGMPIEAPEFSRHTSVVCIQERLTLAGWELEVPGHQEERTSIVGSRSGHKAYQRLDEERHKRRDTDHGDCDVSDVGQESTDQDERWYKTTGGTDEMWTHPRTVPIICFLSSQSNPLYSGTSSESLLSPFVNSNWSAGSPTFNLNVTSKNNGSKQANS